MINLDETMQTLEAAGTEQNRKTWRRHGVPQPYFGVSFANIHSLRKKIKTDHALALQLWATGCYEARVLATMIADPKQADDALLDAWAQDINSYVIADALIEYVARTPLARQKAEAWLQAGSEHYRRAGWQLLGRLATDDPTLDEEYFTPYLSEIETSIHDQENRVRQAMNNALIAIGGREDPLKTRALTVARTIGEVYIDHGDTYCKTPDAATYIEKIHSRRK